MFFGHLKQIRLMTEQTDFWNAFLRSESRDLQTWWSNKKHLLSRKTRCRPNIMYQLLLLIPRSLCSLHSFRMVI